MQSQTVEGDNNTTNHSKVKPENRKKCQKSSAICLIVYGNIGIILGLSLIMLQGTIMGFIAERILLLNTDSSVFKMWQKYPLKVPHKITFFNWTNHKDFFNRSVKPKFEEIGPYSILLDLERVNVVRNDNNNTITFKQIRTFEYDTNLSSNGNLSDRLITINYLTMFGGHYIKNWHTAVKDLFSEYIAMFDPYYYYDTLINNELVKGQNNLLLELSNYFDFIFPDFPRVDGFGWTKLMNGDPNFDGIFNIANGVNRQYGVLNWNYKSETPYYNESCNKIKGSLGDVYSFPLTKDNITIFVPDLCRYLQFYFDKEVTVDGVTGYKYSMTKLSLDNGTLNSENTCFCIDSCKPSGVIGLSSCRYNLNAYISLPHYYNADPSYLEPLEGLNPEKEKHEAYIVVEPYSLLCLEFKLSAQVNILLYPIDDISFFENFPKLYFPIFWVTIHAGIPDELKKYLHMYLSIPNAIIIIGIILMALGVYATCFGIKQFKKFSSLKKSQNIMDQNYIERVPLNK